MVFTDLEDSMPWCISLEVNKNLSHTKLIICVYCHSLPIAIGIYIHLVEESY